MDDVGEIMKLEYAVIESFDLIGFVKHINTKIADNWCLLGGISVVAQEVTASNKYPYHFFQAMMREKTHD